MGIRIILRSAILGRPKKFYDPEWETIIENLKKGVPFKPTKLMPEVKNITIGGCIAVNDGSSLECHRGYSAAHSHNGKGLPEFGSICFSDAKYLNKRNLLHEYAHILCPGHKHDIVWRDTMKAIIGDCDDGTF
jgi:hypothetical protein